MQFHFTGNPTNEQIEKAKQDFIKLLGPFKDEFEEKGGFVTYNHNYPESHSNQYDFVLANPTLLNDFMVRWDKYLKDKQA